MTLHLISIREGHGYEIVQRMRELSGFDVTESAIYPILSRFRQEKNLTVHSVASRSGPNRNIYKITPLGRTRLLKMRLFLQQITSTLTAAVESNHI